MTKVISLVAYIVVFVLLSASTAGVVYWIGGELIPSWDYEEWWSAIICVFFVLRISDVLNTLDD